MLQLLVDTTNILTDKSSSSYIWWYILYTLVFLLFYIFSSPFTGNRELRNQWSGYVYLSTVLYFWLFIAVIFHLPILHYDVKVPVSMFSPLFLASACTLFISEGICKIMNRHFVFHIGFRQNSIETIQNSAIISTACCLVYTQCGYSTGISLEHSELDSTVNTICTYLFAYNQNGNSRHLPTVLVLWCTCMSIIIFNFVIERISGVRGMFSEYDADGSKYLSKAEQNELKHRVMLELETLNRLTYKQLIHTPNNIRLYKEMIDTPMLDMVSWYELATSYTAVDLLIHLKLFVGRFDMRTLQASIPISHHYIPPTQALLSNLNSPSDEHSFNFRHSHSHSSFHPLTDHNWLGHVHTHHIDAPFVYDHLIDETDLYFDWIADCGDGWNPSYQIARLLAQPSLTVTVKRKGSNRSGALCLPRGKLLIIGGDLAYPNPNPETYESRFFRPFQCALPPPHTYDPASISVQKPSIPGGMDALKHYKGPQVFALPGNHDWFDGLQTFLRYICSRDWLGGYLMPQEKSWFAIQLPSGWWLFGLDNALNDDIDVMQFKYFALIASTMGDDDRVILMTHEPDWVINAHEKVSTGENISYLIQLLKGKVAMRLAGDVHNYTRHNPVTSTEPEVTPSIASYIKQRYAKWSGKASHTVYLEDIQHELSPATPLIRTQSMPSMMNDFSLDDVPARESGLSLLNSPPPSCPRTPSPNTPNRTLSSAQSVPSFKHFRADTPIDERIYLHEGQRNYVLNWSIQQVVSWLESVQMNELIEIFTDNDVDGKLLLSLDEHDLEEDMGITSRLRRKKILMEINNATICHCDICMPELVFESDEHDTPEKSRRSMRTSSVPNSISVSASNSGTNSPHVSKMTRSSIAQMALKNRFERFSKKPVLNGVGGKKQVEPTEQTTVRPPPVLIVSGGGGAFMHPTHVPPATPIDVRGTMYNRTCSYPSIATSKSYALLNIFGFRKRNWRFDIVGGLLYFLMVFSALPICNLDTIINAKTWFEVLYLFLLAVFDIHVWMVSSSYISLATWILCWFIVVALSEKSWPVWQRLTMGTIHCLAHSIAAFSTLLFMETFIELALSRKILGQEPLFTIFTSNFEHIMSVCAVMDQYSYGASSKIFSFVTALFDIPDMMATSKIKMCTNPLTMSRFHIWIYYLSTSCYLWVLFTPVVSFVFGSYLYLASAVFNSHMTESFSSLRIESYKNFLRFHITRNGDLEMFVLGVDRCPKRWTKDPEWSGYREHTPSYEWSTPSVWKPEKGQPDKVRLIDYIVVPKNPRDSNAVFKTSRRVNHA